ncbi:MAG: hypothetical protein NHB15_19730 [Methanosarcina barkeri]|nr:hypothetical protein [Methanosarcina sp. ERenArc_MAG2]
MPVGKAPGGIEVTPDGTKVYVVNYASHSVSAIDTATEKVTDTVNVGKYPVEVAIVPFTNSNMTNQSTKAISNATEDIGVEETNLSSYESLFNFFWIFFNFEKIKKFHSNLSKLIYSF